MTSPAVAKCNYYQDQVRQLFKSLFSFFVVLGLENEMSWLAPGYTQPKLFLLEIDSIVMCNVTYRYTGNGIPYPFMTNQMV